MTPELRQQAQEAVVNLMEVLGCMMLQYGLFQADPHAGNLLLQVGENAWLALSISLNWHSLQLLRLCISCHDGHSSSA